MINTHILCMSMLHSGRVGFSSSVSPGRNIRAYTLADQRAHTRPDHASYLCTLADTDAESFFRAIVAADPRTLRRKAVLGNPLAHFAKFADRTCTYTDGYTAEASATEQPSTTGVEQQ
jgi:hypothetical protein